MPSARDCPCRTCAHAMRALVLGADGWRTACGTGKPSAACARCAERACPDGVPACSSRQPRQSGRGGSAG